MSISGNDVKRGMYIGRIFLDLVRCMFILLVSFPVGEPGTSVTTVVFGHRSGKLLATGSEDNAIHIYLIGQPTSLLV